MMKHLSGVVRVALCCVFLSACGGTKERPIQYIYLALGASDATGVGALPLTEGYVYLIARELDRQIHGVFLVNLGVPGARIDLIKEQARVAKQLGTKADLVTLWTGANKPIQFDYGHLTPEGSTLVISRIASSLFGRGHGGAQTTVQK